ncbi:MAG: multiheme c-type cytochrome [Elusimicrobiota bacterium]
MHKPFHTVAEILFIICALGAAAQPAAAESCAGCHEKRSPALVQEFKKSRHAEMGFDCLTCHSAEEKDVDAWKHGGEWVTPIVTPKDCAQCHQAQFEEFSTSHHAKAGEILASLDNVLAEKVAGMPGNIADAVNGCWQCHGSIIKYMKDAKGEVLRDKGKPVIDPDSWPNSGVGRLNPDGSKGSCHACHSRHSFEAKLARAPENCGKCHLGPDHPQIEIYNESKHGIAFHANRHEMALEKDGDWVLGRDYSAAPTCATCHISSYMTPDGKAQGYSHDVGSRISWTLRPMVSTKLNLVLFADGYKEDYPENRALPKIGDTVDTSETAVENDALISRSVKRKAAKIVRWEERRAAMQGVCRNCHGETFVENFYKQFDSLVALYNDKFAKPSVKIMAELTEDGILNPKSPFAQEVQWVFWELWHHEGRRARHGASMMGPDYTHWHGMYEVSKHFYNKFLPAVIKAAEKKSAALGKKWQAKIDKLLEGEEHLWLQGLSPQEIEALKKEYQKRYSQ